MLSIALRDPHERAHHTNVSCGGDADSCVHHVHTRHRFYVHFFGAQFAIAMCVCVSAAGRLLCNTERGETAGFIIAVRAAICAQSAQFVRPSRSSSVVNISAAHSTSCDRVTRAAT